MIINQANVKTLIIDFVDRYFTFKNVLHLRFWVLFESTICAKKKDHSLLINVHLTQ